MDRIIKFFLLSLLSSFFLIFPQNTNAEVLFHDQFNGDGELTSYNNLYTHVLNVNSNGTFSLDGDHIYTSGYDPFYIFTGIYSRGNCASIDFNWNGTSRWTAILLDSTLDSWNSEVLIDGNANLWRFYYNNGINEINGPISINFNQVHTLKVCLESDLITAYLDDIQFLNASYFPNLTSYFGFGSQFPTNYLDNFRIEEIVAEEEDISLSVPQIKQTDPAWKNQTYNLANLWNPQDPTINSWGCALTSAVMVFKYHELNKLPGNVYMDPSTLNSWLKKQKDGYIGNGFVNWLALSRLSKHTAGLNHIKSFDALEFKKVHSSDKNTVIQDLQNNIPDILGVPGHFIVAKGISNNIITINDPGFSRNSLSDYGNTFSTISRFTPSNTDLSYIMLVTDSDVNIELQDSLGSTIAEHFTEESINSLLNPIQNNGDPIKIVLLQKPLQQDFKIVIDSFINTSYEVEIYLYDKDGDVLKESETGNIFAGQPEIISIHFDAQAEIYPKKISFGKFKSDLNKSYREEEISFDLFNELSNILDEAVDLRKEKLDSQVLEKLILFENTLNQNEDTIPQATLDTFLYDVNYLATHL